MDAAETLAAVEDATTTERDRLGSDKALIAATGATLEADAIWQVAATREAGVADAVESWAATADGAVAEAFEVVAVAAADRRDQLDSQPASPDALSSHLQTVESTPERVGAGLIAVPLVMDRLYLQIVSFFVNEADEQRADVARTFRREASDLDPAREALEALDDDGRQAARVAAADAIVVAYDEYATALEEMGFDPRPIC